VSIDEAQRLAEEQDLDLVEVAPNASPPVCRLMDYGKFRYEQSKKEREARKNQKQTELKELRLKPKTDMHDLSVKAKKARRFLESGDKVKFTVRFRGREMAHTNIGREILDQIIEELRDVAIVEQKPQLESRSLSLVVAPNSQVLKAAKQAQQAQNKRDKDAKQARLERQAAGKHGTDETEEEEDVLDDDDEQDDIIEEEDTDDDVSDDFDDDEDDDDYDDDEDDDDDENDDNERDNRQQQKQRRR
jgi:translation initiation factor IF-3